jgi:hypothetical protein
VVCTAQNERRENCKPLTNLECRTNFQVEAIPSLIFIKFFHQVNNHGKYNDGYYNSMTHNKDGYICSPPMMFACTASRHALQEWHKYKYVHLKASKSKLKAQRPDSSNYFNYKNDAGKNASCDAVSGRMLLTSICLADTYTFLMNTWNPLLESYQQGVYKNTLATVKGQIKQTANSLPAVVISMEAAHVDNDSILYYCTCEVALVEPQIGTTDTYIPIDNNCTEDKVHFGIPWGSGDSEVEGDESNNHEVIPTVSWQQRPSTALGSFVLGTRDVNRSEGADCDNVDAAGDGLGEPSQADDGSMQHVEDSEHSRFDLGTSVVDEFESENGDDGYAHPDAEGNAVEDDDGLMQNVEHSRHRRFDLGTSEVDWYECKVWRQCVAR